MNLFSMPRLTIFSVTILAVIAIGVVVRFAGVLYALPLDVAGDEFVHVATAFSFMNNLSLIATESFSYVPSLMAVLLLPFFGLFGVGGIVFGAFQNLDAFKEFVVMNGSLFIIGPRILSALFGVVFIGVFYAFTKRAIGIEAAIIASVLASFDFWLVHESQFGHIWMPVVTLIVCSWYIALRIHEGGGRGWYILGGLSIVSGFWVGFIPALMLPWFLLAHTMRVAKKASDAVIGVGIALLGIAIVSALNPYSFMRQFGGTVIRGILGLFGVDVYTTGLLDSSWRHGSDGVANPISNSIGMVLVLFQANPMLALLAVCGLAALFFRKRFSFEAMLIIGFPIVYILVASVIWPNPDDRYILPLIPSLVIGAAYAISALFQSATGRLAPVLRITAVVLFSGVFFISGYTTINFTRLLFAEDSRTAATMWIKSSISSDSSIGVFTSDYLELPRNRSVTEYLQKLLPDELRTIDRYRLDRSSFGYPYPSYFVLRGGELKQLNDAGADILELQYMVRTFYNLKTVDPVPQGYKIIAHFYPRDGIEALPNLLQDTDRLVARSLLGLNNLGPYVEVYERSK